MATNGILINDIELGYAPISAYHFGLLLRDKKFYDNVLDSHLYMITQRKEITFNNFNFSKNGEVSFEIHQEDNPEIIICSFSIYQEFIKPNIKNRLEIRLHDRKNTNEKKNQPPYNGTQAFSIQERDLLSGKTQIITWFSPDKLFQKHWNGQLIAKFSNDYKNMLEYKVHYVGKSTEQNICARLTGHSTFQQILLNEEPLVFGNIPSNEIMILLLRIKDNNSITIFDEDSSDDDLSHLIEGYYFPNDKIISSDAEKALIKYLQPQYNNILYNSFPNKKDLINSDFHSEISYAFSDPITLIYNKGIIKGGSLYDDERDYISVKKKDN